MITFMITTETKPIFTRQLTLYSSGINTKENLNHNIYAYVDFDSEQNLPSMIHKNYHNYNLFELFKEISEISDTTIISRTNAIKNKNLYEIMLIRKNYLKTLVNANIIDIRQIGDSNGK